MNIISAFNRLNFIMSAGQLNAGLTLFVPRLLSLPGQAELINNLANLSDRTLAGSPALPSPVSGF